VRLIIVLPNLGIGGAERVLLNLANHWSRNKLFDVTIALMRKEGPLLDLVDPSVQIQSLCPIKSGPFMLNALYSFFKLFCLMKRGESSAVLSTLVGTNVVVSAAHYLSCSKFKLVLREACAAPGSDFSFKRWLAKFFYRRAKAIVAVSADVKRDLVEIYRLPESKIVIINNPIDPKYIHDRASTGSLAPGLSSSRPVIVAIGRLVHQKGFDILIEAFGEVIQTRRCSLVIIGDGVERARLQQQVDNLGLGQHVLLIGAHENPYGMLKNADLLVSSSRWEGFPNVILEGMALGIPIVATKCPGVRGSILENCPLISLVDIDDSEVLADAIYQKLKDQSDRFDYSGYLQDFDIEYVSRRYANLLGNIECSPT
jgi:glycosyltransferase involved in cell wall biosynthesis